MIYEQDAIARLTIKRDAVYDLTRIFLMLDPTDAECKSFRKARDLWLRMEGRKAGVYPSAFDSDKRITGGR